MALNNKNNDLEIYRISKTLSIFFFFFLILIARVAQSILGSQGDHWAVLKAERGVLKWYSLIDRGARDSVCEQNSKKSPRDEEGVHGGRKGARAKEGGVWWSGGTEPENCIACSVISLPPGSHSLSLPSSHSPLTPQALFYLW